MHYIRKKWNGPLYNLYVLPNAWFLLWTENIFKEYATGIRICLEKYNEVWSHRRSCFLQNLPGTKYDLCRRTVFCKADETVCLQSKLNVAYIGLCTQFNMYDERQLHGIRILVDRSFKRNRYNCREGNSFGNLYSRVNTNPP